MNDKIKHFCSHFEKYPDCYVLIGGSACALWYENQEAAFRPTKDVDVVLFAKSLPTEFADALNSYLTENKYQAYSIFSEEKPPVRMYRFTTAPNAAAPSKSSC